MDTDYQVIQAKSFTTKRNLTRLLSEEVPMGVGIELANRQKRRISLFEKNEPDTRRVLIFDDNKSESQTNLEADSSRRSDNSDLLTNV